MISLVRNGEPSRPARLAFPAGAGGAARTVPEFQLIWVLLGRLEWNWLDGGVDLALEPGTLFVVRPGMYAEWRCPVATRAGGVFFDITPRPDTRRWPLVRPIAGPIAGLLDYLLWLAEEPAVDWEAQSGRTIESLIRLFVDAPLPVPRPAPEHPALDAALDHVRAVWQEQLRPIDLSEIAVAACVSKEHVGRLFARRYGIGLIRALELIRLTHGETLLTETTLGVGEVAANCGYDDPLYFSKRFRAVFGASPRAYRLGTTRSAPLAAAGLLALSRRLGPD